MQIQSFRAKWLLVLLVATTLVLAGCGQPGPTEEEPVQPAAEKAAEEEPVQPAAEEAAEEEPMEEAAALEDVPQPELCDPEEPVLSPLAQYWEGDLVEEDVVRTKVVYENEKGQLFSLAVSGRAPEAVQEFVRRSGVCFESIVFGPDEPKISLRGIEFDVDHEFSEEYDDAEVADAHLGSFQEGGSAIETVLFALSGERNLVVEIEWLDGNDEDDRQFVIYYAIDPSINNGQWHAYVATCATSGWSRLRALAGRARVKIWRYSPGYEFIHHRTADVAGTNPTIWIGGSTWPNAWTYDTGVWGLQDGSEYRIYGGWTRGSGGGC